MISDGLTMGWLYRVGRETGTFEETLQSWSVNVYLYDCVLVVPHKAAEVSKIGWLL